MCIRDSRYISGGTGTGSAGNIARVVRVKASTIRRTRAIQAGRELVKIGLSDRDGPRLYQALYHGRTLVGDIAEFGTSRRGRHIGEIDVVLDRKRNAIEWQGRHALLFHGMRINQHLVERQLVSVSYTHLTLPTILRV